VDICESVFGIMCLVVRVSLHICWWLWLCVCTGLGLCLLWVCVRVFVCGGLFVCLRNCACDARDFVRTERCNWDWTVGENWRDEGRNFTTVTLKNGASKQPVSRLLDGQETCDGEVNTTQGICGWKT